MLELKLHFLLLLDSLKKEKMDVLTVMLVAITLWENNVLMILKNNIMEEDLYNYHGIIIMVIILNIFMVIEIL